MDAVTEAVQATNSMDTNEDQPKKTQVTPDVKTSEPQCERTFPVSNEEDSGVKDSNEQNQSPAENIENEGSTSSNVEDQAVSRGPSIEESVMPNDEKVSSNYEEGKDESRTNSLEQPQFPSNSNSRQLNNPGEPGAQDAAVEQAEGSDTEEHNIANTNDQGETRMDKGASIPAEVLRNMVVELCESRPETSDGKFDQDRSKTEAQAEQKVVESESGSGIPQTTHEHTDTSVNKSDHCSDKTQRGIAGNQESGDDKDAGEGINQMGCAQDFESESQSCSGQERVSDEKHTEEDSKDETQRGVAGNQESGCDKNEGVEINETGGTGVFHTDGESNSAQKLKVSDEHTEEDSDDETALHIDEDLGAQDANETSESSGEQESENVEDVTAERPQKEGNQNAAASTDTSSSSEDFQPPVKTAEQKLVCDTLRLNNLKIKLEKVKQINRSWQKRKPDISLQKGDKLGSVQNRTNIFDALSADLQPKDSGTDGESSKAGIENAESQATEVKSNSCEKQSMQTPSQDKAEDDPPNKQMDLPSTEASGHAEEGTPPNGKSECSTTEQTEKSVDSCAMKAVENELKALNSLLGGDALEKAKEKADTKSSLDDGKNGKEALEAETTCSGEQTRVCEISVKEGDLPSNQQPGGQTEKATISAPPINAPPVESKEKSQENMSEEEQNMKIIEIFTLHANPEKTKSATESTNLMSPKPSDVRQSPGNGKSNELLTVLNTDGENQQAIASLKKTPQKASEVNWRHYGVKRCPRCSFTTSDESLLRVHTCRRQSTAASGTKTSCGGFSSPTSQSPEENATASPTAIPPVNAPGISPLKPLPKIKKPPPSPKVWRTVQCRIETSNDSFLCAYCNHRAGSSLFIGHLIEHMREYPYTCPYCTSMGTLLFQRAVDITAHINSHKDVSQKFSMFGFSMAKAFLDKVKQTGFGYLNGIWVDTERTKATTNFTGSVQVPNTHQAPGPTSMTCTDVNSRTSANYQSVSSGSHSIGISNLVSTPSFPPIQRLVVTTGMVPTLNFPTAPPAFTNISTPTPLPLVQQNVRITSNQVLPTVISQKNTGVLPISQPNPLLVLVPASVNPTKTLSGSANTSLPNILPTVSLAPSVHCSTPQSGVQAGTNPSVPSRNVQSPLVGGIQTAPSNRVQNKPNNLLSQILQGKSNKNVRVTKRKNGKYFCCECNYVTDFDSDFTSHLWRHFHGENERCSHGKDKDAMASGGVCPFIKTLMYRVNNSNVGLGETVVSIDPSADPLDLLPNEQLIEQATGNAAKGGVCGKNVPTSNERTSESVQSTSQAEAGESCADNDSDCEVIADVGKPVPPCIDLTEETSPKATETREIQKEESRETSLRIESSYSLSAEGVQEEQVSKSSADQSFETSAKSDDRVEVLECANDVTPGSRESAESTNIAPLKRSSMFYVCGFGDCQFSCITSDQFKHHVLLNHRGSSEFPCAHCGHRTQGEEELFRHMLTHTMAKNFLLYKCGFPRCRFGTNLISEFQQHNVIFHKDVEFYSCAACSGEYQSLNELLAHLQDSLLKFVQCPYCSVKTKDRRTILGHIAASHPGKPRQISVTSQLICSCGKKRVSAESRRKSNEASSKAKEASSPEEDRVEATVKDGQSSINPKEGQSCETTLEKDALPMIPQSKAAPVNDNTARTQGYEGSSEKRWSCSYCSFKASSVQQLNAHVQIHNISPRNDHNFECMVCSKGFETLPQLAQHLNTHEGSHKVTVYNCKYCKHSTNRCELMTNHISTDHGDRPLLYDMVQKNFESKELKCKVCRYATRCSIEFQDHFKAHEVVQIRTESQTPDSTTTDDVSKYCCPVCKRSVSKYVNLDKHVRLRHPEVKRIMLYRCKVCPYLSTSFGSTLGHWNKKHPGKAKIFRLKRNIGDASPNRENVNTTSPKEYSNVDWFHCDHCAFSSSVREDFLRHVNSHDEVDSQAESSDGSYADGGNFELPSESIFKSPIKCPRCEYSTKVRVNLVRHMKRHKSNRKSGEEQWKSPSASNSSGTSQKQSPDSASTELAKTTPSPSTPSGNSVSDSSKSKRGKYEINPEGTSSPSKPEFYKCRLCSVRAPSLQSLSAHLSTHKSQSLLKCSYCSFKCTNKFTMIKHLRGKHPDMPRKYEGLSFTGPRQENSGWPNEKTVGTKRKAQDVPQPSPKKLKHNLRNSAYECALCGFTSITINGLEEHFKTSHGVKAFVCSICKFQTLRLLMMEKHMSNVHNQKQMLFKMSDSKVKSSRGGEPTQEDPVKASPRKDVPTEERKGGVETKQHFKCGICSSITGSKEALLDHTRMKHGSDAEPVVIPVTVYKCLDCGRRFRSKSDAKEHNKSCMKRILKESEKTAADDELKAKAEPERTDTEAENDGNNESVPASESQEEPSETQRRTRLRIVYRYTCHICSHSGFSRQRMKEHYYVHYKYFPFKCVYCPHAAIRADRLQNHVVRKHEGKALDSKLKRNDELEKKIDKRLLAIRKLFSKKRSKSKVEKLPQAGVGDSPPDGSEEEPSTTNSPSSGGKSKESPKHAIKREYDPSNPYHCEICNFTTKSKCSLQKHIGRHGAPRLQCNKCDYKAIYPYIMRKHFEKNHPGAEIDCSRINQGNTSAEKDSPKTSLKRKAEEEFSDSSDYEVLIDGDTEGKLQAHFPLQELYIKTHDSSKKITFRCLVCEYTDNSSGRIAAHLYKNHLPKCFQCFYCDYRAYPSSIVADHMGRAHDGEPRKFKVFKTQALCKYNQMLARIGKPPYEIQVSKKARLQQGDAVEDKAKLEPEDEEHSSLKENTYSIAGDLKSPTLTKCIVFCCHICRFKVQDRTLFAEHLSLHEAFMNSSEKFSVGKCGYTESAVEDATSVETNSVNFDPVVQLEDILFLQTAVFDEHIKAYGLVSVDLRDLSEEKFKAVIKASGLKEDDIIEEDGEAEDV